MSLARPRLHPAQRTIGRCIVTAGGCRAIRRCVVDTGCAGDPARSFNCHGRVADIFIDGGGIVIERDGASRRFRKVYRTCRAERCACRIAQHIDFAVAVHSHAQQKFAQLGAAENIDLLYRVGSIQIEQSP